MSLLLSLCSITQGRLLWYLQLYSFSLELLWFYMSSYTFLSFFSCSVRKHRNWIESTDYFWYHFRLGPEIWGTDGIGWQMQPADWHRVCVQDQAWRLETCQAGLYRLGPRPRYTKQLRSGGWRGWRQDSSGWVYGPKWAWGLDMARV